LIVLIRKNSGHDLPPKKWRQRRVGFSMMAYTLTTVPTLGFYVPGVMRNVMRFFF